MPDAEPTRVAAGILLKNGLVLICQRHRSDPYGLQWEFPGGKAEPGEELRETLRRELTEELAIDAEVGEEIFRLRHRYPDRFVEVAFFRVPSYRGILRNCVFEAIEWAPRGRLCEFPFLEADREIVQRIARGELL